ncbi:MAG: sarcosine oxidase subunit gamma [Ornithinimicrobium sp.]|uniref:sarcosine oxidase subunit gamma n=1 Tax=Ornithinimicrobium sp. TaxID=1977084 RepID=UPI003D9B09D6
MPDTAPVAHGPVAVTAPVIAHGWEVSGRRSSASLRLADHTPLAKVAVRAAPDGALAARLGVPFGCAARNGDGVLVVGSGPGEWLLLGAPGTARHTAERICPGEEFATVLDLTHGRALLRLTGHAGDRLLAKVCAINFSDRATPDGTAFRSAVARLVTDVVRDDYEGTRSYLLHCERSSGQYLFDALLDAGRELGIEADGFDAWCPGGRGR